MIKLGKLTDYAIVVMGQLSKETAGAARSAHYLSDKTGVPEPTVAKVLKLLAKENLVVSLRGASGGYALSRASDKISVTEIITAMDGPIAIVSCIEGNEDDCKARDVCPIKGNWEPVNEAIKTALNDITLAHLVATQQSCGKVYDFIGSQD